MAEKFNLTVSCSYLFDMMMMGGALVNARNNWGETPLHRAVLREADVQGGKLLMVELLLQNKADPNIITRAGETALHIAVKGSLRGSNIQELLANMEAEKVNFETSNQVAIVEKLLLAGADIRIQANDGSTVLDTSIHTGINSKVINILKKEEVLVNWLEENDILHLLPEFRKQKITYDVLPKMKREMFEKLGVNELGSQLKLEQAVGDEENLARALKNEESKVKAKIRMSMGLSTLRAVPSLNTSFLPDNQGSASPVLRRRPSDLSKRLKRYSYESTPRSGGRITPLEMSKSRNLDKSHTSLKGKEVDEDSHPNGHEDTHVLGVERKIDEQTKVEDKEPHTVSEENDPSVKINSNYQENNTTNVISNEEKNARHVDTLNVEMKHNHPSEYNKNDSSAPDNCKYSGVIKEGNKQTTTKKEETSNRQVAKNVEIFEAKIKKELVDSKIESSKPNNRIVRKNSKSEEIEEKEQNTSRQLTPRSARSEDETIGSQREYANTQEKRKEENTLDSSTVEMQNKKEEKENEQSKKGKKEREEEKKKKTSVITQHFRKSESKKDSSETEILSLGKKLLGVQSVLNHFTSDEKGKDGDVQLRESSDKINLRKKQKENQSVIDHFTPPNETDLVCSHSEGEVYLQEKNLKKADRSVSTPVLPRRQKVKSNRQRGSKRLSVSIGDDTSKSARIKLRRRTKLSFKEISKYTRDRKSDKTKSYTQIYPSSGDFNLSHSATTSLSARRRSDYGLFTSSETFRWTSRAMRWEVNSKDVKKLEEVGEGGSCSVCRGTWRGIEVAIKTLKSPTVNSISLFTAEIDLMSELRHPYIVQFLGACLENEIFFITEFCSEGDLHTYINKHQPPWKKRVQFARDIARGMNYLHQNKPQILHRDMKSFNILIDEAGRAKVADFGISKQMISFSASVAHFEHIRNKAKGMGSVHWCAPEEPYRAGSDVYSYGLVMWEIVTGKTPFNEYTSIGKLILDVHKPDGVRPIIPDGTDPTYTALMKRCWDHDIDVRPPFSEILPSLEELYSSIPNKS